MLKTSNCKLHFTKFTFFEFFLIAIRFYSQKCYIFAKILKNGTKVLKKIQLNNKILKIMKEVYQIVALTTTGKTWTSNVLYKDYDTAQEQRRIFLQDTENIAYAMIKTLFVR